MKSIVGYMPLVVQVKSDLGVALDSGYRINGYCSCAHLAFPSCPKPGLALEVWHPSLSEFAQGVINGVRGGWTPRNIKIHLHRFMDRPVGFHENRNDLARCRGIVSHILEVGSLNDVLDFVRIPHGGDVPCDRAIAQTDKDAGFLPDLSDF